MLNGYVRVSKNDGSQTLSPQRDAMLQAGVEPERIYQDLATGRHDARPGLQACLKALQPGSLVADGYGGAITPDALAGTSPQLNEHLNRFGSYELDLTKLPAPLPFGLTPPRQSSRHTATAPV